MKKPKIGIRPIIDGRRAERANLEEKVMSMAMAAKKLIEENLRDVDGEFVSCIIADTTISGSAQAAACAEKFAGENVVGTLSVTSCWCYGSETMDTDPMTMKAVWGFNGTESLFKKSFSISNTKKKKKAGKRQIRNPSYKKNP